MNKNKTIMNNYLKGFLIGLTLVLIHVSLAMSLERDYKDLAYIVLLISYTIYVSISEIKFNN